LGKGPRGGRPLQFPSNFPERCPKETRGNGSLLPEKGRPPEKIFPGPPKKKKPPPGKTTAALKKRGAPRLRGGKHRLRVKKRAPAARVPRCGGKPPYSGAGGAAPTKRGKIPRAPHRQRNHPKKVWGGPPRGF